MAVANNDRNDESLPPLKKMIDYLYKKKELDTKDSKKLIERFKAVLDSEKPTSKKDDFEYIQAILASA